MISSVISFLFVHKTYFAGTHLKLASNEYPQHTFLYRPSSVAPSDARLTGDQEVASSIPAEPGNILSRSFMEYFLRSFSPFP